MIFVRDKGRMCNNILQYGHVYAWAHEHSRKSVSMRFCYKYQYFHICTLPHYNFFTYFYAKCAASVGLLPIAAFHNPDGNIEAMRTLETKNNVLVEGWSVRFYDLFLKYRKEITALFTFKPDISIKISRLINETSQKGNVKLGVHIRRGDYKTWNGGKYYYGDDVYIDYIRQFIALQGGRAVTVYICGNDPSIDKARYSGALKGLSVYFPDGNPAEDLCLLSECDYLIGAPSTFSLVAVMYRDIPLYWIMDGNAHLSMSSFGRFATLFKQIQ